MFGPITQQYVFNGIVEIPHFVNWRIDSGSLLFCLLCSLIIVCPHNTIDVSILSIRYPTLKRTIVFLFLVVNDGRVGRL